MEAAAVRHKCKVPVFTLMPDHMHALVVGETESSDTLAMMRSFKIRTGIWLKAHGMPFRWQKDFDDHVVRFDEGWRQQARYIALNPVRKGWVEFPEDWPHTASIGYELGDILGDLL
jgi:REP element-mobilizing transposase RayT